ncbi:MAG: hypothetical protein R3D26_21930 [Cyanobacteriota/Melainabacteria group bacterium]
MPVSESMKRKTTSIAALFIGTLMLQVACAFVSRQQPITGLSSRDIVGKLSMTPQRTIEESFGGKWQREVMPGVTASVIEGQFVLKGKDRAGEAWTIEDPEDRGLGGACFAADVDGNGEEDLIFWFATGSCGFTTFSVVDIYFFDKKRGVPLRRSGQPLYAIRFEAAGQRRCIHDLVLDEDKKSSLLLIQDLTYGKVKASTTATGAGLY